MDSTPSENGQTDNPAVIVVDVVDRSRHPLLDACFLVTRDDEEIARSCDADDGTSDGRIAFRGVPPGTYDLVETVPPVGYASVEPRSVKVRTGRVTKVRVPHRTPVRERSTAVPDAANRDAQPPASGTILTSSSAFERSERRLLASLLLLLLLVFVVPLVGWRSKRRSQD